MRSIHLTVLIGLGLLGLGACSEGAGPGGAQEEVRQELTALLDESGFFGEDFGEAGAAQDAAASANWAASRAEVVTAADVTAPRLWGRRRGIPASRDIHLEVDDLAGTATGWKEVVFDGRFLLDITDDGQLNPTEKPLQETVIQYAEFVRLDEEVVDEQGHRHRWRLAAVSPAHFQITDPAKRTVVITQVTVAVNGEVVADITDPSATIPVEGGVPHLHQGDEVTVTARVSNESQANTPPTFVFLHLFHASPGARVWLRLPMAEVEGDPGVYARTWTVRQTGRERIAVDALDSRTFVTESEDDYRANIWGVPYMVLDTGGGS
jgi:hypothetical protein